MELSRRIRQCCQSWMSFRGDAHIGVHTRIGKKLPHHKYIP